MTVNGGGCVYSLCRTFICIFCLAHKIIFTTHYTQLQLICTHANLRLFHFNSIVTFIHSAISFVGSFVRLFVCAFEIIAASHQIYHKMPYQTYRPIACAAESKSSSAVLKVNLIFFVFVLFFLLHSSLSIETLPFVTRRYSKKENSMKSVAQVTNKNKIPLLHVIFMRAALFSVVSMYVCLYFSCHHQ